MTCTPGERTALRYLAGIAVLGAVVQVAGQLRHRDADAAETRESLQRQIAAVDSARLASKEAGRAARGAGRGRVGRTVRVRSADSLPPVGGSVGYGAGAAPPFRLWGELPAPAAGATASGGRGRGRWRADGGGQASPVGPVDLDRATVEELDALPRIGPALAARIVADRAARGAFGSLEAFGRVRGVGPAMLRQLAPLVTFSAAPRLDGGR